MVKLQRNPDETNWNICYYTNISTHYVLKYSIHFFGIEISCRINVNE